MKGLRYRLFDDFDELLAAFVYASDALDLAPGLRLLESGVLVKGKISSIYCPFIGPQIDRRTAHETLTGFA